MRPWQCFPDQHYKWRRGFCPTLSSQCTRYLGSRFEFNDITWPEAGPGERNPIVTEECLPLDAVAPWVPLPPRPPTRPPLGRFPRWLPRLVPVPSPLRPSAPANKVFWNPTGFAAWTSANLSRRISSSSLRGSSRDLSGARHSASYSSVRWRTICRRSITSVSWTSRHASMFTAPSTRLFKSCYPQILLGSPSWLKPIIDDFPAAAR